MNEELETTNEQSKPDYLWILSCVLVTAVAAFLRFFWLGIKPLHHDEGVNSYFLTTLFRSGEYKYDPANYHGPDLYYIALAFAKIFGLNTLSIRASVAVFGILVVVLAFFLKRYIGKIGSLFAAFFLALSPGFAYISRYFIHEILFVFFSFGIVIAILFFIERRRAGIGAILWTGLLLLVCFLPSALNLANVIAGENSPTLLWTLRAVFFLVELGLVFFVLRMLLDWNEGRPIYLILASASAVLLFATKETAFITLGTMAIAAVCVFVWRKIGSSEGFARNKFGFFMALNVIGALGAAIANDKIREGFKTIYDNLTTSDNVDHSYLFFEILGLIVVGALGWIVFLIVNRQKTESALAEDAELTWTNFLEKLTAADTWEFVLVKSAFGGAVIAVVWFFLRCVIDLLIAWKSGKSVSAALDRIVLSKVDFWILAAAAACFFVAGVAWLKHRPKKISADLVLITTAVTIVFLYVGTLFFSSFFTYPEGLQKAFEAYAFWTKTGKTDHTQNGEWAYLRWGLIIESPLLVLSALGTLIALFKTRHRFAMFAGVWAFGLFAAYTLIPYKTPWLALSFLLPMCIAAGYAVNELLTARDVASKVFGGILAVAASGILAFQTYDINFVRYDSDAMPYIYAHTKRGFLDLVRQIEHYADKSGKKLDAKIEIVSPDYWPMPWYMNDYPNAVFEGRLVDATTAEMIVAKKDEQDADVVGRYAAHYKYAGDYPLRPGVELMLLVRKDLADADALDIYAVFGEPLTVTPEDDPILPESPTPAEPTRKRTVK
ncbi:MAG: glycosyltransferase family 39 protein [Acidobacteria bacterium]|nr:glycosyltransferase family 39 protein [Acidobacteriota bacterium]